MAEGAVDNFQLEPPPAFLRVHVIDERHGRVVQRLLGVWLTVKVCARRLPTDPVDVGFDVLRGLRGDLHELANQVSSAREIGEDRAPDGGRWFPYAMTHPESGMNPADAAARDMRAGYMAQASEHVDRAVAGFSRADWRARWTARLTHLVPLLVLTSVIAIIEYLLPATSLFAALAAGIAAFLVVDLVLVDRIVMPLIEDRRRHLLDRAADAVGDVGLGAASAGLSRRDGDHGFGTTT